MSGNTIPEEQGFSDSLSIQSVFLEISSGEPFVELSMMVTDIDIFEHIDKPYLTAVLGLADIADIVSSSDISGGEKLHIRLKSLRKSNTVIVSKTFFIDKVITADKGSESSEFFVFHLIEDLGYISNLQNVNRPYSGKPSDIITTIANDFLSKELNKTNTDFQSMKLIVPNLTPIEAMCWVKNRATTEDGYPFFLYSTLVDKKLQFSDLQTMMIAPPLNGELPYTFSESSIGNSDQPDLSRKRIINKHQTKNTDNLFQLIQSGLVGADYNYLDVTKNTSHSFSFDLDSEVISILRRDKIVNRGTPLFDNNRSDDTTGDITSKNITQIGSSSAYENSQKSYLQSEASAQYKYNIISRAMSYMLMKNKIDIVVDGIEFLDGDANCTIGRKLSIHFLRNVNVENLDKKYDRKKSGDFLIFACKHSITPRSYNLTLSATKLSNGEVS